jgi:hypothetical protein
MYNKSDKYVVNKFYVYQRNNYTVTKLPSINLEMNIFHL